MHVIPNPDPNKVLMAAVTVNTRMRSDDVKAVTEPSQLKSQLTKQYGSLCGI